MEDKLKEEVVDFIESIKVTTTKETNYIKSNDWTIIVDTKNREDEFNLQHLLVTRAVEHATNLYKMSKEDLGNKQLKKAFDMLLESYEIHIERSNKYITDSDWSNYLDKGLTRADMKNELTFQSDIMKMTTDLKNKVRKLNISEEGKSLDIKFHSEAVASLMMYNEVMLERYPEIEDYIKKRREKEA